MQSHSRFRKAIKHFDLQQRYCKNIKKKKKNQAFDSFVDCISAPDFDHCKNRLGWSFDCKRIVMEVRPNQTVDNSPQHRRHVPATPSKQPVAPSNTADTASVSQRLQKELMSLMMIGGDLGVSAFPEGESIFAWIGTIMGGKGTAYEGLSYKLSLRFPLDYPFKPPQVKFETMCFHPNVDQFGNICLDILQDKWSSAYDCRTILLSIQSLLGEPNPDSPLNNYAAKLWNNEEDYRSMVHRQYYAGEAFES